MAKFEELSDALVQRMALEHRTQSFAQFGFDDSKALRRNPSADAPTIWRPNFIQDIDKVMYCPYYNRYTDKTQVFSLMKNDDITRRSLHVQLVSRIARTIGRALHLNLDLIEAIALGHDIGHPPFAHSGEVYLDELFYRHAGRHFSHNIHSVRVLDTIFPLNISLQTLSGIAGHNGEIELSEYRPMEIGSFEQFDEMIEECYVDKACANRIQPSTLEGNVVRISDIIAYLGKDRQDAFRIHMAEEHDFSGGLIGVVHSQIINNLVVNIVENSYGKPYIKLDDAHFEALQESKRDNYSIIYESAAAQAKLNATVKPMMGQIYGQLLEDLTLGKQHSPIFTHHIEYVNFMRRRHSTPYEKTEPNQMVVDYIASMTDDYFIDLHHYLFPDSDYKVEYRGYFD
ncbi:MAG: HD domain-containing protein [Oscillospiraceae bacterium]|nr:HD domain-containing protein [Oscillospiraceae bacterium]